MKQKKADAIVVRPEALPAMQGAPNVEAWIAGIVEKKLSDIAENKKTENIFEPFFREKNVSVEMKRRQTVFEQRKWALYFARYGCLTCGTKEHVHGGCGMCKTCHLRTAQRLHQLMKQAQAEHERKERQIKTQTASTAVIETESKPLRHASWCTVCSHPERAAIERDYVNAGNTYGAIREIMRKYGLKGTCGLYKHAKALGLNALRDIEASGN